jgi:metacaspase-1
MSAAKSENFRAVLDSCFSGGTTGKFRVRSLAQSSKRQIASEEKS